MTWRIEHGRIEDVCPRLTAAGEKFHAVLCDPPYDLGFMGKEWDKGAEFRAWAEAIKSVLYPGAIVLAFGGTRTWHRLACGFEDAGFQMWDTLMWLYGQGFPKAQDVGKLSDNAAWNGFKTCALKPAWEPILAFRLPSANSYAENALQFGSGALNIDAARIGYCGPEDAAAAAAAAEMRSRISTRNVDGWGMRPQEISREEYLNGSAGIGRFPANVVLDATSSAMLDEQSGELTSGANPTRRFSDKTRDVFGEYKGGECIAYRGEDSGGASRFFYCAKASSEERDRGLYGFPERAFGQSGGAQDAIESGEDYDAAQGIGPNRVKYVRNFHPTVKPIDLSRWLASLVLPPDTVKPRRLFVPFSGSGSEIIGALQAGWDEVVGVEREADYVEIAKARIIGDCPLFNTLGGAE